MKHRNPFSRLCAAVITVAMLAMPAAAATSGELLSEIEVLQSQNEEIRAQIAELEQQSQDNLTEMEEVVRQKGNIDHQVALLNVQIRVTQSEITAYTELIADKQLELDQAQARFDALHAKHKERIRAMEENGSLSYWSVLFKANSFSDFLDRLTMIEEITNADRQRLDEIDQAAKAVTEAREELVSRKTELELAKSDLDEALVQLEQKRQESDVLLSDLVARGEDYQILLEEGEERLEAKLLELAQRELDYTQALQKEWEEAHRPTEPERPAVPEATVDPNEPDPPVEEPGTDEPGSEEESTDEPDTGTTVAPPVSGEGWLLPCSYAYVSSPFDPNRLHPILGYVRPHNGIDLAASMGTPIYASRSGTVTVADYEWDGAGNYVFINHGDGFSSVYMHMDYYIVGVGEYVSAGEIIGYVGTTGLSEGPHLHFGIAYNGVYVNPANYIDF